MVKKTNTIQIIQVGHEDWSEKYSIPKHITWIYLSPEEVSDFVREQEAQAQAFGEEEAYQKGLIERGGHSLPKSAVQSPIDYSGLVLTGESLSDEVTKLAPFFDIYRIFYENSLLFTSSAIRQFLQNKMAQNLGDEDPQQSIDRLGKALFSGQYGAKIAVSDFQVSTQFMGSTFYHGQNYLELDGFYGSDYQQIVYSNKTISFDSEYAQDLFFEHIATQGVETKILVRLIQEGTVSTVLKTWEFEGSDVQKECHLSYPASGYLSISLFARGTGRLQVGPCHYRLSRCGFGHFVLGGERFVDEQQNECMYYFDPQDFTPPLCVYFSGYRTAEGFEGYGMMKELKCPFLLICDPRLSGGAFYIGSQDFEQQLANVIAEKLAFLGFDSSQLVMSGLSMGSFGAVYHGTTFSPHAFVLGKPIFSLGDVALKEKIVRPGGFQTSLDLLNLFGGGYSQEAVNRLNERFWWRFDQAEFSKTKFFVGYMQEDDYDSTAFKKLVEHTDGRTRELVSRGIKGRHNDHSDLLIKWFVTQYQNMLRKDFGRK